MAIFFDESYYLKSKLAQLESVGEKDANGNAYTLAKSGKKMPDAGKMRMPVMWRSQQQDRRSPLPWSL